ncbi:MAG TPA: alpha-amylase family glycosyl hydrolase [Candidatus Saccharimonadales bacterium]|nr:alpha-amylase family glycosyl hydrolase [Candidatus Saccharimonadales bacterium]
MNADKQPWFRGAVVYQIYPRSFKDSNNDGVGDLPGIIAKLDYLAGKPDSLGVTAIWLSPFYPSPMVDFGYDISDYQGVDPVFGTIEDFKRLIDEAHSRNLKVIIDFVPNHTSDQHPWFVESKSSRDNPKHDWYVWKDPGPDDSYPNNWLSALGGPAWEFDRTRQQFYLHSFLKEQPDLNWDNPEVRAAMMDNVRFWLNLGADGLRVDAVLYISKDPELRDDPPNPNPAGSAYTSLLHKRSRSGPNLFKYLDELSKTVKNYGNRVMITEAYFDVQGNLNNYLDFYYNLDSSVCAPFNFEGILMDWDATQFQSHIDSYQSILLDSFVPIYCLGNHDQPRLASRIGRPAAKVAGTMLLTLPGIPFIYYGDELGMVDVPVSPENVRDPQEKNEPGIGLGRDPERSPMQWSGEANAGFSHVDPWLPVAQDFSSANADALGKDENSIFNLYRKLLTLRNASPTLRYGIYGSLNLGEGVFAYTRSLENQTILVLLNFTNNLLQLSQAQKIKKILVSTTAINQGTVITELQPNEAIVAEI